ncbi:MAG: cobalamin B12-binding domain-containing protein [Anaerovoracaceae bacterium]|jgi:methylmalonyl-CoA mutase cobalamin-binding subunit
MDIEIKRRFNEKELPDMKTIRDNAKKIASGITIGETLFMKKYGVRSESEYKKKMMAEGKIMKHSVIGYNSWKATADGMRKIYNELRDRGSYIDRIGTICDWIMGVPEKYRSMFSASGSMILHDQDEWNQLGQIVPVHPHLGDHMIGSLNGVDNVVHGLTAGVTSIGNLAQYFTYEYPGLDMEKERTEDYITCMGIMGEFKDQGVVMHCNLDDGYGAQFHDVANLLGWAKLERYIAEELMGGRVAHAYGNLFSDSMLRVVFNRAISMIDPYGTPGTFVNGNTIDYGPDMARNYGVLMSYAIADAACQYQYPTGYAINPIPFTEAIRIPSPEEIIEVETTIDVAIEKAPYYARYIDWDRVNETAEKLTVGANIFFERVINCLDDLGVDIEHAGQIAAVVKAIGPEQLETAFGAGQHVPGAMRGRIPIQPTSIVQTIDRIRDDALAKVDTKGSKGPLDGLHIVVASTDVHEFGKEVVRNVLSKAGASVFDLGTAVSIPEIADALIETGSSILCVSTYNGLALTYGKKMKSAVESAGLEGVRILMGGRLNEAAEGGVPEDVSEDLAALGINVDNDIDTLVDTIASYRE